MKFKSLISVMFLAVSSAAVAAPHLTPQQCNDYPFKNLKREVTHTQLNQELVELEAVGYDPSHDDVDYPQDLMNAEHKLHQEYARDCTGATSAQR